MPVQGADFRRMRNARGGVVHKRVVGGRRVVSAPRITIFDCLTFTYRMLSMRDDHFAIQYNDVIDSILSS